jgi:hypothetical protein
MIESVATIRELSCSWMSTMNIALGIGLLEPLGTEFLATSSLRFWACAARRISSRKIQMKSMRKSCELKLFIGR